MATEMQKFAKFVKDKRTALGKSAADLSEDIFQDRRNSYIGDLESGRRKGFTIDMIEKILKALNTEIRYYEHTNT
jgi:transcriptional regulator with XRE-family HTH domain